MRSPMPELLPKPRQRVSSIEQGLKANPPSAFAHANVYLSQTPIPLEDETVHGFIPYKVSKFRKLGDLVSVPRIKRQGKLESDFQFPLVLSCGKFTLSPVFRVRCRLDYFIACLSHTVFSRLYRLVMLRVHDRHGLKNYLLQFSYSVVIRYANTDRILDRFLGLVRTNPKKLRQFVYASISKMTDNEKVFLRACLRAVTPRSQWLAPLGGKVKNRDFTSKPYDVGFKANLKQISDQLRVVFTQNWLQGAYQASPRRDAYASLRGSAGMMGPSL